MLNNIPIERLYMVVLLLKNFDFWLLRLIFQTSQEFLHMGRVALARRNELRIHLHTYYLI